jgi:hypothetical protein
LSSQWVIRIVITGTTFIILIGARKIVDTQDENCAMVVFMNRQTKHESISMLSMKRVIGWDMRVCKGWDGLD